MSAVLTGIFAANSMQEPVAPRTSVLTVCLCQVPQAATIAASARAKRKIRRHGRPSRCRHEGCFHKGYFRGTIEARGSNEAPSSEAAVTATCNSSPGRAGSMRTSGPAAKLVKNASGAPNMVTKCSDVAPGRFSCLSLSSFLRFFHVQTGSADSQIRTKNWVL